MLTHKGVPASNLLVVAASPRRRRRLYGANLDAGAIASTLARGKPHEQAAAIGVLG